MSIRSSCSSMAGRRTRTRAGSGRTRRRLREALRVGKISNMSNVEQDRHSGRRLVDGTHSAKRRIRRRVSIAKAAQIFRYLREQESASYRIRQSLSPVYAGCSFSVGPEGRCTVGDFTLLNGALVMAEERIEIGSHCLDLVERRHRRFRFSSARARATIDRCTGAGTVFERSSAASKIEDRARQNLRQRLDRHERNHPEGRDHR